MGDWELGYNEAKVKQAEKVGGSREYQAGYAAGEMESEVIKNWATSPTGRAAIAKHIELGGELN